MYIYTVSCDPFKLGIWSHCVNEHLTGYFDYINFLYIELFDIKSVPFIDIIPVLYSFSAQPFSNCCSNFVKICNVSKFPKYNILRICSCLKSINLRICRKILYINFLGNFPPLLNHFVYFMHNVPFMMCSQVI